MEELLTRLVEEAGVLLLPASIYRSELTATPADRFRIGIGRATRKRAWRPSPTGCGRADDAPRLRPAAIERAATSQLVLDTVRDALIAHAEGRTSVPPPLHMDFPEADGDCHVKAGWITGAADFTVKIATGFYGNPALGLSANHGLVCVVSARTGQLRALLDDRGLLTAWRTAAAGALITHAMARPAAGTLAVFGTGEQARLQALWLAKLRPSAWCWSTAAPRTRPKPCATNSCTRPGRPARRGGGGGPGRHDHHRDAGHGPPSWTPTRYARAPM